MAAAAARGARRRRGGGGGERACVPKGRGAMRGRRTSNPLVGRQRAGACAWGGGALSMAAVAHADGGKRALARAGGWRGCLARQRARPHCCREARRGGLTGVHLCVGGVARYYCLQFAWGAASGVKTRAGRPGIAGARRAVRHAVRRAARARISRPEGRAQFSSLFIGGLNRLHVVTSRPSRARAHARAHVRACARGARGPRAWVVGGRVRAHARVAQTRFLRSCVFTE